jgi:hypothetical protein
LADYHDESSGTQVATLHFEFDAERNHPVQVGAG